jgi:glycolate oxidase FAD binding subunit
MAAAAAKDYRIRLGEAAVPADVVISTRSMTRVLQYEPRDLTISVEAGMKFYELTKLLAANHQMVPLDPPNLEDVTVAGVLAANLNGSRRRLYGTARDLVIGMEFATLEGKVVKTGGMVVKNVAGLDMAKLMIGSFGTLAAIGTANFKLNPMPKTTANFLYSFATAAEAYALRDRVMKGQLQPSALDLLNPAASTFAGLPDSWNLVLLAPALPERFAKEYPGGKQVDDEIWTPIREFTPRYLHAHRGATVARYSTTHTGMKQILTSDLKAPAVARAGSGIVYVYGETDHKGGKYVLENAPVGADRWPSPGSDFPLMQRVKNMLDPKGLLNKGALYGRI